MLADKAITTDTNSATSIALENIQGSIKLTISVTVPIFQTIHISGITRVKCHNKSITVIMEPVNSKSMGAVTAVTTYTEIKPDICTNLKVRTVNANLTVVNAIPPNWILEANWKSARMLKEKEQDTCSSENKNKYHSSSKKELKKWPS